MIRVVAHGTFDRVISDQVSSVTCVVAWMDTYAAQYPTQRLQLLTALVNSLTRLVSRQMYFHRSSSAFLTLSGTFMTCDTGMTSYQRWMKRSKTWLNQKLSLVLRYSSRSPISVRCKIWHFPRSDAMGQRSECIVAYTSRVSLL